MPKKIIFESAVHQFSLAAKELIREWKDTAPLKNAQLRDFAASWHFKYDGPGKMVLTWDLPQKGILPIDFSRARFYTRGDAAKFIDKQKELDLLGVPFDKVAIENRSYFKELVLKAFEAAYPTNENANKHHLGRSGEEGFHDDWAKSENVEDIDVQKTFTACTSPELRAIFRRLGDLRGKSVLDVGCGLGEASVFFALQGAEVTATDLSSEMLAFTARLGKEYGVNIRTHKSSADALHLDSSERFDVIYVGNLFHHVPIEKTIELLKAYLKPDGTLCSWDPLAYNPVINIYRKMAMQVRTPDEHPLTGDDLKLFRKHFGQVSFEFYWLTSLLVFILMYVVQRHNPNEVRFWKRVVQDAPKWQPLYKPLEWLDRIILSVVPPLRLLCWNVVVFASKPTTQRQELK